MVPVGLKQKMIMKKNLSHRQTPMHHNVQVWSVINFICESARKYSLLSKSSNVRRNYKYFFLYKFAIRTNGKDAKWNWNDSIAVNQFISWGESIIILADGAKNYICINRHMHAHLSSGK